MSSDELLVRNISNKLREIWRELDDTRQLLIKEKSGFRDIVTDVDIIIENKLRDYLISLIPGTGYFGEETVRIEGEEFWIVDPVDGTTNFSRKNPHFATQVAFYSRGLIVLGVIYDPSKDEMFTALQGTGAFLNGEKIRVSNVTDLKEASAHTGLQYSSETAFERISARIKRAIASCRALRIAGSACLDLCYVACGRADVFWEEALKPWDVAAGKLIVEEAGGNVDSCLNEPFNLFSPNILASNGKVQLLKAFREKILDL
ncbi:inositol monophosphatase family protein [Kosmotoga pacifica]|uniref:Inositol-1-monophosphatase n=1 Tax=Kosmotoga pacifica TaxID=1330330 RepID=A0A0G2ZH77_9BACT|nr:inositol monophosphatase family protein [Kosmotoga pacifica]AKI98143.1 inositol monophosphatase [Kosmotoga pacifica]